MEDSMRMYTPSALLIGAVLTFGVAALANLYLPPASIRHPTPLAEPPLVEPRKQFEEMASLSPLETSPLVAQTGVPDGTIAEAATEDKTQKNQTTETAPSKLSPQETEPAVQKVPRVLAANSDQRADNKVTSAARRSAESRSSKTPDTGKKRAARSAADSALRGNIAQPSSRAVFAVNAPPEQAVFSVPIVSGTTTQPFGGARRLSLSAVAGNRAWVRLGDSRTVVLREGEVLPDVGRVTAITENSITFDDGTILRLQP